MELIVAQEVLFIVPALYVLGVFLKQTPYLKDWLIPYILMGASIAGCVLTLGVTPIAIANGVIAVGVAVLGNQLVKQATIKG